MDGAVTELEFIQTGNYFYFNYYFIFQAIVFVWLNLLVPDVPNLYPQYHLILSI